MDDFIGGVLATAIAIVVLVFIIGISYDVGKDTVLSECNIYGKIKLDFNWYECKFEEIKE